MYLPLSFDLLQPSDIVEKAVAWNGLLGELRKTDSEFYVYLLLGRPSDDTRSRAFEQAYQTLAEDGARKELVPDEEAARFADSVEKAIKAAGQN